MDKNEVMISGIAPRRDNLNAKGMSVNKILSSFCTEKNLLYIDNSNIRTDRHLNNIDRNFEGTYVWGGGGGGGDFVNAIKMNNLNFHS